jgi:hypothetical protein
MSGFTENPKVLVDESKLSSYTEFIIWDLKNDTNLSRYKNNYIKCR